MFIFIKTTTFQESSFFQKKIKAKLRLTDVFDRCKQTGILLGVSPVFQYDAANLHETNTVNISGCAKITRINRFSANLLK